MRAQHRFTTSTASWPHLSYRPLNAPRGERCRRSSLLAWYDYPISTGPLEAVNNKIKLCQRQAFGYRNREFFELKLFTLHESRYALIG